MLTAQQSTTIKDILRKYDPVLLELSGIKVDLATMRFVNDAIKSYIQKDLIRIV